MSTPLRLPPQKQQRNRPHLTLTPSLHPSTLSLSSPALLTTPFTLTLSIRLSNSDSPITVYTNDCFLSSSDQTFYQSDYRLRSLSTGTICTANVIHKRRMSLIRFADPHEALLELQPGEVVTREVRIGIQKEPEQRPPQLASPNDDDDHSPPTNLANLAICATPLSELTAGEEYQVQLAHGPGSGWPNHVWWWMECGKDEIIRDVGKKGPDGLAKVNIEGKDVWAVRLMSGIKNVVTVEIGEGAVLRVVE
ncbi:hypothetical protein OEA41_002596 [Lepraria neglecta]|uniref:Uncharacterized protein n=1 Tax=Lepraria neglecta TaxID=209136 RepID=A0AAE0DMD4_9LECA|nr:hypothetical protein OEA41_002596 [Lepraria neglecta]